MQRVPLWGTLYFLRGGKRNAKQDRMEGAAETAEDIIASLKPLVDEYLSAPASREERRSSMCFPTTGSFI